MQIKAYAINPWDKTIKQRWIDPDKLEDIYRVLSEGPNKVDCFTSAARYPNGDILFVDDDGMMHGGRVFKVLTGRIDNAPLIGIGLWVGSYGPEIASAKSTREQIRQEIVWTNLVAV